MSSTWKHVLGLMRTACPRYSMSEEAQRELFRLAWGIGAPGLIVELGVCHGKTALMLAWVAWQHGLGYLGVDTWGLEGSQLEVLAVMRAAHIPAHGYHESEVTLPEFLQLLQPKEPCALLLKGNTHTVPLPMQPIDLLLIDAGHDEENVREDCRRWIPLVKPGGLVVFDDYPGTPAGIPHCHDAVRRNADWWTGSWETLLYYEGRMMVRRKPAGEGEEAQG